MRSSRSNNGEIQIARFPLAGICDAAAASGRRCDPAVAETYASRRQQLTARLESVIERPWQAAEARSLIKKLPPGYLFSCSLQDGRNQRLSAK